MQFIETCRRGARRLLEPQLFFSLIAVLLLAAIWTIAIGVIRADSAATERAAAASSRELLSTYEAQVVRALREIDETLNLIKFWPERTAGHTLADLREKGLLPPDLLFVVSIADRDGTIVDSTRPLTNRNIADQDYFRKQRESDALIIGQPPRGPTGDSQLQFSRRLNAPHGVFDGVVTVGVDAAYFVSSYDASKLGQFGVLSLIGSDGISKVRRTGEATYSGERIAFKDVLEDPDAADAEVRISTSSWDLMRRWTGARELYGFPLTTLVGLSVTEQLAPSHRRTRAYIGWAAMASTLVIVLTALLGRMSWRLEQSRLREVEIKLVHAQRVEYLAYHDGLTGLANRSMFSKVLGQSIDDAHRQDKQLAVAFLDLDRFKLINDSLGHEAGDQLLRDIALRLTSCVRESDTVARLGGDEFVVLLPELADDYAALVARKILAVISAPFTLIGQELRITASIGISSYPQDGHDEQTLTKHADIAMYQAKAQGKNNFQFYSAKLDTDSLERLSLESSLRHALERNEFRLHYQAKRDTGSGCITGVEALLRWHHPDLGMVAPERFIPIAEETGLIIPIGKWVLATACAQIVAWQKAGLPRLSVAVNLTRRQFNDERLLADLEAILASTGMEARLLELEISESLFVSRLEDTLRILTGLKAAGIGIAIDDFGTGYLSLATLQRFPLDTIKIGRSLIGGITSGSQNTGLADAIIAMGKSLSLRVIAQGVETIDQADFSRTHACDESQGFYFNMPAPADEFERILRTDRAGIADAGEPLGTKSA